MCWVYADIEREVAHLPIAKNSESGDVPLSTGATVASVNQWPSFVGETWVTGHYSISVERCD